MHSLHVDYVAALAKGLHLEFSPSMWFCQQLLIVHRDNLQMKNEKYHQLHFTEGEKQVIWGHFQVTLRSHPDHCLQKIETGHQRPLCLGCCLRGLKRIL